ncbi:MAG: glycogen synthase [Gemmatimonadaceae bacterium]|jgi:starch synthase|nr:glycogen synthase [Gemmatimonadaceae bacterium]
MATTAAPSAGLSDPPASPPSDGRPTIVHLAAEYWPFARSGGLAEAVMGLATHQARAGHPVVVFLPLYRSVREVAPDLAPIGRPIRIDLGFRGEEIRFFREVPTGHAPRTGEPRVVFVDVPQLFHRAGPYGEHGRDYADNARRFAVFSRAVLDGITRLIDGPVVVHAHDWHTALALMYLRSYGTLRERFHTTPTVLSVHNAGYQGHFAPAVLGECGIPPELYNFRQFEWYDRVNFLKGGLAFADMVVTVSPTHADELRTPAGGFGLHDMFRWLGPRFTGIANGIDQQVWDPATDPQITARFTPDALDGKARCKAALQRTFGLPIRKRTPLFAMTCRMVTQKGLDLVLGAQALRRLDAQFVFLGAGEARYERALAALEAERPQHVAVQFDFTDRLEHRLMAGADLFLMPSQYEPCGLAQMRAQRYGVIPIGRRVGGIADTIEDGVTGFLFDEFHPGALDHGIARALSRFGDRDAWTTMMTRAMRRDFGWTNAVQDYVQVYARARARAAAR